MINHFPMYIQQVGFGTVFDEEEAEGTEKVLKLKQRTGLRTLTTASARGVNAQLRFPAYKVGLLG